MAAGQRSAGAWRVASPPARLSIFFTFNTPTKKPPSDTGWVQCRRRFLLAADYFKQRRSQARSVVMPTHTMGMAVGFFIISGVAQIQHVNIERQRQARQRMIHVHIGVEL